MNIRYFLILIFLTVLFSCTTNKSNSSTIQSSILEDITGNNKCDSLVVLENKPKTYSLYKCIVNNEHRSAVNFFIYSNNSDSLIYQNSIANGDVYWVTDDVIKVDRVEGIESESDNNDYFFNVSNSSRTAKPIFNQK
ncbi:hypothetical protein DCC35_04790 [Mangrovivirga cuniculi]|uniref:C-type lysozyme inhibitor domain-containing protein n=1 Tax=Mangrovivirga cuniculi TaxID=2715131 RepID=A0A4D7JZL9_9BACT|nr:hypothetical protein DCC35_04790 [Mangrovivirga cuniculi]